MPKSNIAKWIAIALVGASLTACDRLTADSETPKPDRSAFAISTSATQVPLNPNDEDDDQVGALIYRGGLELTSSDKHLGGLSGLIISKDGKTFLAVSDKGHWVRGSLGYDGKNLSSIDNVEIAPLLGLDGNTLPNKDWADAESLIGDLDGTVLVSFEHMHRVWAYDLSIQGFSARPTEVPMPTAIHESPSNASLEGLAQLGGETQSLFAITENARNANNDIRGWIERSHGFEEIGLKAHEPYNPTDLAVLPSGDILILERRFSIVGGVGMALRKLDGATLETSSTLDAQVLAELAPPHTVDNMEGLAVRQDEDGRTLIYIVSDDNFNPLQRTLLLMFELQADAD